MGSLPGEVLHWGLLLTSTAGLEKHEEKKKKRVSFSTQGPQMLAVLWDRIIRLLAKNQPLCKHTLASYTITQHAPHRVGT